MVRRTFTGTMLGAAALFAIACSSESPTSTALRTPSARLGLNPDIGGTIPREAEGEYLEVCKDYVNLPGSTPPATTDFLLEGPELPPGGHQFSVNAGGCVEVFTVGGDNKQYTITETVPAGYSASYVVETYANGNYTVGSSQSGNVATATIGGVGGNGGTGSLVIFTNTELPPPPSGCTLTQGYWKTHSARGPAPYDDAWLNIGALGADTPFFGSGYTWYQIFQMPPAGGNAYLQLAHQYMAAKLNVLNGAATTPAVDAAITAAEAFFGSVAGPSSTLTTTQKNNARAWASTLASYNEGSIGPGHCDD